jgi:hypothetical protein
VLGVGADNMNHPVPPDDPAFFASYLIICDTRCITVKELTLLTLSQLSEIPVPVNLVDDIK